MEKIKSITDDLVAAITDTEIFKDFIAAKNNINEDELGKINSYKCLKAKLINEYSAEADSNAKKMYSEMMPNKHIREYISCEKRLLSLVTEIYDDIGEKISANS